VDPDCGDDCRPPEIITQPGPFAPNLPERPLTMCAPAVTCPATHALRQDPRSARPHLVADQVLADSPDEPGHGVGRRWTAVPDLLRSGPTDAHVVVEIDDDRRASLRFGDGETGRRPEARSRFHATFRIGNGADGNVGAGAISRLVTLDRTLDGISIGVRNPMPATGGTDPETTDQARLLAPHSFRRVLARAVTPADYATIIEHDFPEVQRANATARFTGSHTEMLVAVDQLGARTASSDLLDRIARHLDRYRRIGHDVSVVAAVDVAIELAMLVCVDPAQLRAPVELAVRRALSSGVNADGSIGYFHPDRRTFGGGVYVSEIVAAVQALDGVASVTVTRLNRRFEPPMDELEDGVLTLGPLEIARLDDDRSQPELGVLELTMGGGR
jgi:predicted phage baseplate assembly protein